MKLKILVIITLAVILSITYLAFSGSKKTADLQSPISQKTSAKLGSTAEKSNEKFVEYIDPAGFKFMHSAALKPQDMLKENKDYYASIKLTEANKTGSLTIDANTTKYNSIEEWSKNNQMLINGSTNVKLADLEGKRIKTTGKTMVVAVDTGVLFTLTANYPLPEEVFWDNSLSKITSTFEFEQPAQPAASTGNEPYSDDIVFEGEEVIE